MSTMPRKLNYGLAIREAFDQLLETDERVFLIGQGVNSPWYVGNTTEELFKKYGSVRIIDTPVAENTMTGTGVGAALAGMKPVVIHPRMDFMLLAMEPIINQAANWNYMFSGQVNCPVTIRSIINRGGEQGAQHSQALQALLAHVPGLKVVVPSTAYDAKGLMIAAVNDPDPVVYIDDRWLYDDACEVPEEIYEVPIGKGICRREGRDLTIVGSLTMAREALMAAETLSKDGIDAEVIDLRSLRPLDEDLILLSLRKTRRLLVADACWGHYGVASEIAAIAACHLGPDLLAPVCRVTLPDAPAPSSSVQEQAYYIDSTHIVEQAQKMMN